MPDFVDLEKKIFILFKYYENIYVESSRIVNITKKYRESRKKVFIIQMSRNILYKKIIKRGCK